MPIFRLPSDPIFPHPSLAEANGLLAVGGDLSPRRLLAAYSAGIFPWYSKDEPILWWSPDPRLVLEPDRLHIPRSLKKTIRRGTYTITFDCAFDQVIQGCAEVRQESGTWITQEMQAAYSNLHCLGLAHSVEAWEEGGRLVGGLYGLALGGAFFGESMFALQADASKVALVVLVARLQSMGFSLVDCQMTTDHLLRFGAQEWARDRFLAQLHSALGSSVVGGLWR